MAQASKPRASGGPGGNGGPTAMQIDTALVRKLAELLTDNQLTEIEVEDGGRKIRVARNPAHDQSLAPPAYAAAPALTAPPMPGHEDIGAKDDAGGSSVKSPMVGTAFLSAEPGGAPFIAVGDTVKAGDTLLIVEAMKVMNPITAPEAGTVKKIMVSDAQPVEFDQPLVVIG